MLLDMDRMGCAPNAITFSTFMCTFLENNDKQKVVELLHKMKERNVMPDAYVCSVVVDLLAKDEKYCKFLDLFPSFPIQESTKHAGDEY